MAEFEHNSDTFGYINLDELEGVQTALNKLGYDPGVIDGKDGPNTQKAVRQFQTDTEIKVDGIAGPQTKGTLLQALDSNLSNEEASVLNASGRSKVGSCRRCAHRRSAGVFLSLTDGGLACSTHYLCAHDDASLPCMPEHNEPSTQIPGPPTTVLGRP